MNPSLTSLLLHSGNNHDLRNSIVRTSNLWFVVFLVLSGCATTNEKYIGETYGDTAVQQYAHRGIVFEISDERTKRSLLIETESIYPRGLFGGSPVESEFRNAAAAYLAEARSGCNITDSAELTDDVYITTPAGPGAFYTSAQSGKPVYEVFYAC